MRPRFNKLIASQFVAGSRGMLLAIATGATTRRNRHEPRHAQSLSRTCPIVYTGVNR